MFDLDDAMADVVVRASQPALAAIKLAWWRERLEELDQGKIPAEPRLNAAVRELLPRGIRGQDLSDLEDGWAGLLAEQSEASATAKHGAMLFRLGSQLLGLPFNEILEWAGAIYAWAAVARRGLCAPVAFDAELAGSKIPGAARPLTALTALAARDLKRGGPTFEAEASPARAWCLLRHRLTGRFSE